MHGSAPRWKLQAHRAQLQMLPGLPHPDRYPPAVLRSLVSVHGPEWEPPVTEQKGSRAVGNDAMSVRTAVGASLRGVPPVDQQVQVPAQSRIHRRSWEPESFWLPSRSRTFKTEADRHQIRSSKEEGSLNCKGNKSRICPSQRWSV
ncbi:unnamed protein product [Menidia menidia]|uniref:(Atlantic silverside) hypothetical protein n=1 Tax=Menidia menidia TaxID=238744 RepID=A0A8S4AFL6_9TELE|nr:unnamed protein product [Menidia menidia]